MGLMWAGLTEPSHLEVATLPQVAGPVPHSSGTMAVGLQEMELMHSR